MNPFVLIDIAGALALCITYMLIEIKYVQLLLKKSNSFCIQFVGNCIFYMKGMMSSKAVFFFEWDCNSMNILIFFQRCTVEISMCNIL